jgi:transposase-like protein
MDHRNSLLELNASCWQTFQAIPAMPVMNDEYHSVHAAAQQLGIKSTTLYDWLGQSRHGLLVIRGQQVTIDYFQGGAKGQGRIQIPASEVERIRELMRVQTCSCLPRKPPVKNANYPGITVPLGRPK